MVINLVKIIDQVILDGGIHKNKNRSYEVVVPFLVLTGKPRLDAPYEHTVFIPSGADIVNNSTEDKKIVYVANVLGNKYTILGDFYNFKGDKKNSKEVLNYYNTFLHTRIHFREGNSHLSFTINYKREDI